MLLQSVSAMIAAFCSRNYADILCVLCVCETMRCVAHDTCTMSYILASKYGCMLHACLQHTFSPYMHVD